MREPQWAWAVVGGLLAALAGFSCFEREGWRRLWKALPATLWAWLVFLAAHAALFGAGWVSLETLLAPAAITLGGLAWAYAPLRMEGRGPAVALSLVTAAQGGSGLLQAFGIDPLFRRLEIPGLDPALPAGFTGQHTIFGLLMAWLAFAWLWRGYRLPFLLCAAAVALTRSAFSLASLLAGTLWILYRKGHRKTAAAAATGLVVAAVARFGASFDDDRSLLYASGRLEIWALTARAWMERPWLGYGLGAFSREFPAYHQGVGGVPWREAHNEWLEYAFNTGLVGLAFLSLPAFSLACRAWRLPASPGKDLAVGTLLVLGVNSLGNFPLQLAPFATLAIYSVLWIFSQPA